jgi:hypothetical protein
MSDDRLQESIAFLRVLGLPIATEKLEAADDD